MNAQILVATLLIGLGLSHPASAQLGGRSADEWIRTLESATRVNSLRIPEVIDALKIAPGQVVADIGAGSGLFTLPMALKVKPGGTVYAVDIDQALLDHIRDVATEQGLVNIQGVLGLPDDPAMPANVDLALIADVLHHIEHRPQYLKALAAYLKPGGRIAIVDFRPPQSPHRTDPALVVSEDETTVWMAAAGLKVVETIAMFSDKWFVVYGRQ